jgi:hypothetical protein
MWTTHILSLQIGSGVAVTSPFIIDLKTTDMMLSHAVTHSGVSWSTLPAKPMLERD